MTLVRKSEKHSSLSYGEEPNNCALAHCRCNNVVENFDRHVTQTLCKNYSRQYFVQDSRAFEGIGISGCMCGVSEFNVGQIQSQGGKLS